MGDETYLREPEPRGDLDDYGNYINGDDTYKDLAWRLQFGEFPPVFSWTDQEGTRLDILMVFGADQLNQLGEGQDAGNALFVATRFGMFGFRLLGDDGHRLVKTPSYVAEKLGINPSNDIAKPLADLINGVAKEILT